MPLSKGKSSKAFSKNVKELVDTYKQKGSIGTSHPKNKKSAIKQAVAISYREAGKSKKK